MNSPTPKVPYHGSLDSRNYDHVIDGDHKSRFASIGIQVVHLNKSIGAHDLEVTINKYKTNEFLIVSIRACF